MNVENVRGIGEERCQIGAGILENLGRHLDDFGGLGHPRARLREQRDAVPQGGEPAHQRHHDALRAAIAFDRQPVVRRDHDVHGRPSITTFGA